MCREEKKFRLFCGTEQTEYDTKDIIVWFCDEKQSSKFSLIAKSGVRNVPKPREHVQICEINEKIPLGQVSQNDLIIYRSKLPIEEIDLTPFLQLRPMSNLDVIVLN